MKLVDYECQNCGEVFEVDEDKNQVIECISCFDTVVKKLFSAVPVHYKGTGWTKGTKPGKLPNSHDF